MDLDDQGAIKQLQASTYPKVVYRTKGGNWWLSYERKDAKIQTNSVYSDNPKSVKRELEDAYFT